VTDAGGTPAWENPVRARLRAGEAVFGVTLTTPSLDVAARVATLGFDFLWVEMEHSPITLETLRHIVLATRDSRRCRSPGCPSTKSGRPSESWTPACAA